MLVTCAVLGYNINMSNKLILLDSNSLINRAYYAIPPLNGVDGTPTNAVYGFVNMMLRIISEHKPTHMAAAFDLPDITFRKKMYEGYKADRKGMPDELAVQLPLLKNLLSLMNIEVVEKSGFEADDIIGTLAKQFDFETLIVTGDRDSLQLIDDNTKVILTKRGISDVVECTVANMPEVYGVEATQVVDLKSIMGDKSDGITGIVGIGEVTAKKLINQYGSLQGVYDHIDDISGKLKERLISGKDDAELSYKLATIDCAVPLGLSLDDLTFDSVFSDSVRQEMLKLGFKSIVSRMKFKEAEQGEQIVKDVQPAIEIKQVKITDKTSLENLVSKIKQAGVMGFLNGKTLKLAYDENTNYQIAIKDTFFAEGIEYQTALNVLSGVLADDNIKKLAFDYKTEKHLLANAEVEIKGLWQDVMIEAYCVNSLKTYRNYEELLEAMGIDKEGGAAGLFIVHEQLAKEIKRLQLDEVYYNIELPLVEVLYGMEVAGFSIDTQMLEKLNAQYRDVLNDLSKKIYELAQCEFNINSPKQLGEVLFVKLGLPHPAKKNKSGNYSTAVETLEKLRFNHPIIELIMSYRDIAKLQSTYIEGMRPLVKDGKIHTIFRQAITSTGRLSSTEPNLQNIPIRKEEGSKLRAMFIASEGCKLIIADYSQIELRLMAAFSGDEVMLNAFKEGEDIHSITAAAANGVPLSEVTPQMRRSAKAVNFGIIYGISDFGLAADLGLPVWKAREFIVKFFETYPKVKPYIDNNVEIAKKQGYIRSMSGRIRFFPEFASGKYQLRAFAERAAMNMPLQGSASDIIKIAMIKADKAFKENNLKTKLIMQVHDELIADAPIDEIEIASEILRSAMENAVKINVKLTAEAKAGNNWQEAK